MRENTESWRTISRQFDGISLNMGVALGQAVLHQSTEMALSPSDKKINSDRVEEELNRLDQALEHLNYEIQNLVTNNKTSESSRLQTKIASNKNKNDSAEILEIYLLLAKDPGWKNKLRDKIKSGCDALEAVDQTLNTIRPKLASKESQPHWQERMSDFEDISNRLKRHLITSETQPQQNRKASEPIIIVADRIGPAELLEYDRNSLKGLILVEQSHTSHVAIVARSLDIPVVGGLKNIMSEITPGDSLLVDGNEGRVYVSPATELVEQLDDKLVERKGRPLDQSATPSFELAETLDGVHITLLLNAGLVEDVDHIESAGAEGVGLYRTEIPFMMRPKLPNVAEQTHLYKEILNRAGKYPIVFRTLDVGGDKVLPYLERLKSEMPIVDRRSSRVVFDRPILLRYQLRALIRACAGRELTIMLPMVAEVSEVKATRELVEGEIEREREKGNMVPTQVRLGAMIEVPSLTWQLPQLFSYVNFLSVGSNDLFQFFYAIDREYPRLSDRYDALSLTFLRLLKSIQEQCQVAHVPLSLCGEMAGRPLEALALIGLGFKTLSMSAAAIPHVKKMIRSLTYQQISDYMTNVCGFAQANVRQSLLNFARDHGVCLN